jgi:hypothetical protein
MAATPIRVIFLLKEKPLRNRKKALLDGSPDEIMCSLRLMPRAASMRRAQEALGEDYKIDLACDGTHPLDSPAPGLRVIHIELSTRKARIPFFQACMRALKAMRLAELSAKTGQPLSTPLMYPSHAAFGQTEMDKLSLHEQLEWFKRRMGTILMASSSEIERQSLEGHVDASLDAASLAQDDSEATSQKGAISSIKSCRL